VDPNGRRQTKNIGKLVAVEPMAMDGEYCLMPSAASRFAQQSRAAGAGSAAAREQVASRQAVRMIKDPHPVFTSIAFDPKNNQVVLGDENNFGLLVYDRLENTPPTARLSEPKRIIQGPETYLNYNCGVYVDPESGDIYSINNDDVDWMSVFDRSVKGNSPPTRKVHVPHAAFGIAASEERKELFITVQDDHAVAVFRKDAEGLASPIRVLQGSKTGMGDPHGIAIDAKAGLMFVTNWGSSNDRLDQTDSRVRFPSYGGVTPTLWTVLRRYRIPGSDKLLPPSITVYRLDAGGNVAPLRVIQGSQTQLNWPTAIAVDAVHGELFVANDTADSITVYSSSANGNVAPIRVIKGPRSMVKNPTGVAYDGRNEELWVANMGNHSATVYRRTASGDAAPLRVIRNGPTAAASPGLGNPNAMVFDTKREEILTAN
jgi:DNA-binding beta-propeller fold protein YncE